MRHANWLTILLATVLVGCASEPRPSHGLSALRIKVVSKPNNPSNATHISVYDHGSDVSYAKLNGVDTSDLRDIVVWVEPAAARPFGQKPPSPVTVALSGTGGSTSLAAVASVGQTILFRNNGSMSFSAYCVSDGNQFNLGMLAAHQEQSYVVKSAGLIEVMSDSAETAIASIYAAPASPVFLTQADTFVDVNDLSPGQYLVVSWHPRLPGSVAEVDLSAERVTHITINVGVNGAPKSDRR